jgi:maltose alpha-D-glucosyltransferase/alpha-amylase
MPFSKASEATSGGERLWYKDAVIYQLHVKSFCDSNGDGIGDFGGLTLKLDYLQSLGVSAIWLLPFYPSPQRDDGYDIADYFGIHQSYGTLGDFRNFLKQAHRRGIRVITELVINHTSDQHQWFQHSRAAPPGSPWRDFYVWSATNDKYSDARIIFKDFESSNWSWDGVAGAYYWHRFYAHQPDLNFENPRVLKAVFRVIDYWMAMGVDGMRLDAVPYLYEQEGTSCENLPQTYELLRALRAHIDKKFGGEKMLLAEANQWPEDAVAYFGSGDICNMAFHFPLMPRMYMALQMEDWFPIVDILEQTPPIPPSAQWAIFLRNHDELTLEMVTDEERDYMYRYYAHDPLSRINLGIRRRLAPLMRKNRRRIELMNILLFSLPGTPIIYYGDEIGMGDNHYLGDRDGVRTPMQWSTERNAGFSNTNPQKLFLPLIIDPEFHYQAVNVEIEELNLSSLLWWMRRVITMRRRYSAFARGSLEFVHSDNATVLAFVRTDGQQRVLVVVNLSRFAQVVELDLTPWAGLQPQDVFSTNRFPIIDKSHYVLSMGFHDYFWLHLQEPSTLEGMVAYGAPAMAWEGDWMKLFSGRMREHCEQHLLPKFLQQRPRSSGRGGGIRTVTIAHVVPIRQDSIQVLLLFVAVQYTAESADIIFLPLCAASGESLHSFTQGNPALELVHLQGRHPTTLFDGSYHPGLHRFFHRLIRAHRRIALHAGVVQGSPTPLLKGSLHAPHTITLVKASSRNTSFCYDNGAFFKFYRRLEAGVNPDVEITQALSTAEPASHLVPACYGSVEYISPAGLHYVVGMLSEYVYNTGALHSAVVEAAVGFYEQVLSRRALLPAAAGLVQPLGGEQEQQGGRETVDSLELRGLFWETAEVLGRELARLHGLLAAQSGQPAFKPESFSVLYQRSLYQSFQSRLKKHFTILRRAAVRFEGAGAEKAQRLLGGRETIMALYAQLPRGKIAAKKIRIHGDLHLGQIFMAGGEIVFKDFEGRSDRALSERRLKRCSLRDVASLLHSFYRAATNALRQHLQVHQSDIETLQPWVAVWFSAVGNALLRGYFEEAGDGFLPADVGLRRRLLMTYLMHHGITELGSELEGNDAEGVEAVLDALVLYLQNVENLY